MPPPRPAPDAGTRTSSRRRIGFGLACGAIALSALAGLAILFAPSGKVPIQNKPAVVAAAPAQSKPSNKSRVEPEATDDSKSKPKSVPEKESAPPARANDTGRLAGKWVGADLTLFIRPDGKGRAELATFSQGQGFWRITDGEKPAVLSTEFAIEIGDGEQRFSFTIAPQPGQSIISLATPEHPRPTISYKQGKAESTYRFAILPAAGADELTIREAGGKMRSNPLVLKREIGYTDVEKSAVPGKQGARSIRNVRIDKPAKVLTDFNTEMTPLEGYELLEVSADIACADPEQRGFDFFEVELVVARKDRGDAVPVRRAAMGLALAPIAEGMNSYHVPTALTLDEPGAIKLTQGKQSIDIWPRVTGDQKGPIKIVPNEPLINIGFVFSVPLGHDLLELRIGDTVVPLNRREGVPTER